MKIAKCTCSRRVIHALILALIMRLVDLIPLLIDFTSSSRINQVWFYVDGGDEENFLATDYGFSTREWLTSVGKGPSRLPLTWFTYTARKVLCCYCFSTLIGNEVVTRSWPSILPLLPVFSLFCIYQHHRAMKTPLLRNKSPKATRKKEYYYPRTLFSST